MSGKMYLKDKLEDDELDLSMMQLTEIPVKEIEQLGNKVLKLNLSHNLLTSVPANLPLLTNLTNLDLSKNQIVELPENFGQLSKLKTLDLYCNQISKLPVSFAQLKSLKWLDLKENPLVPELAKAAGPCLTKTDCELAAKKVVARLQSIESQLFQEKKKRLEVEEKAQRQKERKEEAERERQRQEKKLLKEKRREEARQKDVEVRDQYSEDTEMIQKNGNSSIHRTSKQNGQYRERGEPTASGFWCFGLLLRVLLFLGVGAVALSVSLLWLYTDGKMDSDSIQRALPEIQRDVEKTLIVWSDAALKYYTSLQKAVRPYAQSTVASLNKGVEELSKKSSKGWDWLNQNYGDSFRSLLASAKQMMKLVWLKIEDAASNLVPVLTRLWTQARPHLETFAAQVNQAAVQAWTVMQATFPVFMDWLTRTALFLHQHIQQALQNLVEAFN